MLGTFIVVGGRLIPNASQTRDNVGHGVWDGVCGAHLLLWAGPDTSAGHHCKHKSRMVFAKNSTEVPGLGALRTSLLPATCT